MVKNKVGIGMGIVLIIAIGFFMFPSEATITGDVISEGNVVGETEFVKIPLNEISSQAKWYEYGGAKYFVVQSSKGEIKVAFDACDICGGKKGYRQEGNDMVCNNCGRHFVIDQLGSKNVNGGGCWPSHLEHSIEGDFVMVKKSDISKESYRF